jgi:hypothetical protein
MRKYVIMGSYWLGTLCGVFALLVRGLDVLGVKSLNIITKGSDIGYHSLMDGTLFFYVISIATTTYAGFNSQSRSSLLGEKNRTDSDKS